MPAIDRSDPGGEVGLAMDLTGCEAFLAHRYGHAERRANEAALIADVETALARLGVAARAAVAPTVGLAWAACRFGDDALEAELPRPGESASAAPRDRRTKLHDDAIEAEKAHGMGSAATPPEATCPDVRRTSRRPRIVEPEEINEVLAAMPIAALRIDADTLEGLAQLSIDRIESLLPLPRDEVAARFGPLLARRLDEALGLRAEPLSPVRHEPPIEVERIFASPVTTHEGLRLAVRAMLAEFVDHLRRRERGVMRLRLVAERVDHAIETVVLSLGAANRRAGHLAMLLEPRIDRIDPGLGVERLTLSAIRSVRLRHRQRGIGFDLDDMTASASPRSRRAAAAGELEANAAAFELADALAARFGADSIRTLHAVESHLPEASEWSSTRLHALGDAIDWSLAPRPTRLREPPEPVLIEFEDSNRGDQHDANRASPSLPSCPVAATKNTIASRWPPGCGVLCWRGGRHAIECWIGPERLAETWWQRDEDAPVGETIVTREYWRVRLESGWWIWIFRRVVERSREAERCTADHLASTDDPSGTAGDAAHAAGDRTVTDTRTPPATGDLRSTVRPAAATTQGPSDRGEARRFHAHSTLEAASTAEPGNGDTAVDAAESRDADAPTNTANLAAIAENAIDADSGNGDTAVDAVELADADENGDRSECHVHRSHDDERSHSDRRITLDRWFLHGMWS